MCTERGHRRGSCVGHRRRGGAGSLCPLRVQKQTICASGTQLSCPVPRTCPGHSGSHRAGEVHQSLLSRVAPGHLSVAHLPGAALALTDVAPLLPSQEPRSSRHRPSRRPEGRAKPTMEQVGPPVSLASSSPPHLLWVSASHGDLACCHSGLQARFQTEAAFLLKMPRAVQPGPA